jgi:hypothetical protein
MQDRQLAHELSESGRKYVIENHVWEHALAPLRKQIALLLEKGRNGAIASE